MSRSRSFGRLGTSSSLLSTGNDSISPANRSEAGALTPTCVLSKPITPRRVHSLNAARHERKLNLYSPESTSSSSEHGSSSPAILLQQSMLSPPPPPPPGPPPSSSVTISPQLRNSSLLDDEAISTASPKKAASLRFSQPQDSSDEEREKPDSKGQRLANARAVDHRQQTTASIMQSPLVKTNRIRLHVYDLIAEETIMQLPWGLVFPIGQCFNAVNSGLHTLGTGAYHVGIEINGIEYAYGANSTSGLTGVFTCMPMSSPGYQYRTTIELGDRALIRKVQPSRSRRGDDIHYRMQQPTERYVDGREVVREMALEYMGLDYDLLRKNCVTFAHDACLRLGVKEEEIPDWFRNLCVAGASVQDVATSTMEPLSRVFSACDMEGFTDLVKENGFEVITDDRSGRREEIVETGRA